jgi:hypothetical protein
VQFCAQSRLGYFCLLWALWWQADAGRAAFTLPATLERLLPQLGSPARMSGSASRRFTECRQSRWEPTLPIGTRVVVKKGPPTMGAIVVFYAPYGSLEEECGPKPCSRHGLCGLARHRLVCVASALYLYKGWPTMKPDQSVVNEIRLAVEVLATHAGSIHVRLQEALPHVAIAQECNAETSSEELLRLRIGAGLVEGGDKDDESDLDAEASDAEIAKSIALLSEERAIEIARDILYLYEIMTGVRRTEDIPELAKLKGLRVGCHGAI